MKAAIVACGLFIAAIIVGQHDEMAGAVYAAAGWVVFALNGNRPNPPRNA